MSMLYAKFEQSLSQLCRQYHAPFIDLNARLNHDPSCFFDETHFTDYGNRIVGNDLADSIAPWLVGIRGRVPVHH